MPNVSAVPRFEAAIARPPGPRGINLLSDHLRHVGEQASDFGQADGGFIHDWLNLAGLLHDVGKARGSWQRYIHKQGPGTNHAFLGSLLFFFLIQNSKPPRHLKLPAMLLCRDIAHHHGVLGDLDDVPPWMGGQQPDAFDEVDWPGVVRFLQDHVPQYAKLPTSAAAVKEALGAMPRSWRKWFTSLDSIDDVAQAADAALRIPTSRLIAADRFDAAAIDHDPGLDPDAISQALNRLDAYREQVQARLIADHGSQMATFRSEIQDEVLTQLAGSSTRVTLLQMPTGTGKTWVSVVHSLRTIGQYQLRRLIYVAPYLSIVSQNAEIIRQATGLEVMEQHHLALPKIDPLLADGLAEGPLLLLESWQSPIVVTTFNQMFRALFPYSAQQSMRLIALENAAIVIDEPQIMDAAAWNAFLLMVETTCRQLNARVLIMSATVPPDEHAMLRDAPRKVVSRLLPSQASRFRIRVREQPMDIEEVIQAAFDDLQTLHSVAIIVNTIGDVARLSQAWQARKYQDILVVSVHGAMHAVHKRYQIQRIEHTIKCRCSQPILVIATQTLEAGVDLSFEKIFRARPIVPSVVQAAGRVNRHGQSSQGELVVFDLVRPNAPNTRPMVYRDRIARDVTDSILTGGTVLLESDVDQALTQYYADLFERNHYELGLEKIKRAASGTWSALGGLEPFGASPPRYPVFVPVAGPQDQPDLWIDEDTKALMNQFHVDVDELYAMFLDPSTYAMSFIDRKRFLNLFGRFVTSLPFKLLKTITLADPKRSVQSLSDPHDYSKDLGLAHWFIRETSETAVMW